MIRPYPLVTYFVRRAYSVFDKHQLFANFYSTDGRYSYKFVAFGRMPSPLIAASAHVSGDACRATHDQCPCNRDRLSPPASSGTYTSFARSLFSAWNPPAGDILPRRTSPKRILVRSSSSSTVSALYSSAARSTTRAAAIASSSALWCRKLMPNSRASASRRDASSSGQHFARARNCTETASAGSTRRSAPASPAARPCQTPRCEPPASGRRSRAQSPAIAHRTPVTPQPSPA